MRGVSGSSMRTQAPRVTHRTLSYVCPPACSGFYAYISEYRPDGRVAARVRASAVILTLALLGADTFRAASIQTQSS